MTYLKTVLTLIITFSLFVSCQEKSEKKVEKHIVIKKDVDVQKSEKMLEAFGADIVDYEIKDININDDQFEVTASITNKEGKKEEKTITLAKEDFVKAMNSASNTTINLSDEENTFTWKSDDGEEISPKKGMFISDEGFEKEISEEIEKEHGQNIKNIKTIDVQIENQDVVIKADVILEDGKEVQKTIKKELDENFGAEEKDVKVQVIKIEGK
ncbi:hypothetical protein KMW28_07380 [Flammeovirga yaeyamensis]|uniref:Uncharacterized protein n=1 Tax=Flammeovirga yaeyamensis TaxID=367791 RepID=A0AAX1NBE6_9BACT|nr:hypothetical protein [Flammeovirga yaeyamensis]MBB3698002.1 hypothetical protein [Flammeovirga yaeyamensis]NMF35646.1 hypothetical protein [Flammeovirga yaeyamensis]QWG03397.1 hypothetical protein KMW28_07380 [Flammeovirga yaeyamensis]